MTLHASLAGLAALSAMALGVIALLRKTRSVAAWCYFGGMVVLAMESLAGWISLQQPPAPFVSWVIISLYIKSLWPGMWLCFSLVYSRGNFREFLKEWRWPLLGVAVLPFLMCLVFTDGLIRLPPVRSGSDHLALGLGPVGVALHFVLLVTALCILINLEKTFRASVGTMRWRVKFVVLGLAVVFGVRIYTISQALLYSSYSTAMSYVETVALLVACPLMAIAYLRDGFADLDIYPSRAFLQNSVTVFVAGGYLVVIGLLAQVVAYLGGVSSFPAQAFIVLLGLIGLAILLLSNRARVALRMFVSRHFKRPLYDFRTIWSSFTRRLSKVTDSGDLCARSIRLVSETFDVLSVSVFLVDESRKHLTLAASTAKKQLNPDSAETVACAAPAVIDACRESDRPVELERIDADWARALLEATPKEFEKGGAHVMIPLAAGDQVLGLMVLGDRVNGNRFTEEEVDLLKCMGEQMSANLLSLQLTEKLIEGREMEAFQAVSAFFVHDMKNAASSLNLMLQNLPKHFDNPEFRADALRSIGKTVDRINDLTRRLSSLREKPELRPVPTNVNRLIEETLSEVGAVPGVETVTDLRASIDAALDRDQIRSVVTNLVMNAREAVAPPSGRIEVSACADNGSVVIEVKDNGRGMSAEFQKRALYRPFQSTKKKGLGIGMYQTKAIVEAHGGTIEVESKPGEGALFRVVLPGITD